jgi:uncharacterized protein involved in type VI secretion and phage assembly
MKSAPAEIPSLNVFGIGLSQHVRLITVATVRPACTQYRESDLEFFSRLLASEGLSWRFEHDQAELFEPCREKRRHVHFSKGDRGS